MSDLISRSEVLKIIDEIGYVNCKCNKDFKANSCVDKVRQTVVEMPVAFDLEKVITELKELKTYKLDLADAMNEIMKREKLGNYVCLEDVIELIKIHIYDCTEPLKTT